MYFLLEILGILVKYTGRMSSLTFWYVVNGTMECKTFSERHPKDGTSLGSRGALHRTAQSQMALRGAPTSVGTEQVPRHPLDGTYAGIDPPPVS